MRGRFRLRTKGTDGVAVRAAGRNLYIFGALDRGVLNGVYELLHRNTDLIFARPDEDSVAVCSSMPNLSFGETDFRVVPSWKERHFALVNVHFDPWTHEWSMRNFANYRGMFYNKYHILSSLSSFFSSSVTYEYGTLLANGKYFGRHPEFYGTTTGAFSITTTPRIRGHLGPLSLPRMSGADPL